MDYFPIFAVNNTYGIQAYDQSVAEQVIQNMVEPGGCGDQGRYCKELQDASDPDNYGNNETVNNACLAAFGGCWENVYGPYEALSGVSRHNPLPPPLFSYFVGIPVEATEANRQLRRQRNPFDIAHLIPDSFPPPYAVGFLNNKWVQTALGAKINYTEPQGAVADSKAAHSVFCKVNGLG